MCEPGKHMLMEIVGWMTQLLVVRGALRSDWREHAKEQLLEKKARTPVQGSQSSPMVILEVSKQDELLLPCVLPSSGSKVLAQWDELDFRELSQDSASSQINVDFARICEPSGIWEPSLTMLRHGWLVEKRAQWSLDDALKRSEVIVYQRACTSTASNLGYR